jgi:hypothetical protein
MCVQCEITVFLQAVSCSISRNTHQRGRQNLIILYLVLPEYTLKGYVHGIKCSV